MLYIIFYTFNNEGGKSVWSFVTGLLWHVMNLDQESVLSSVPQFCHCINKAFESHWNMISFTFLEIWLVAILSLLTLDDHSRVKLESSENDYINASLVSVEEARRAYILSQVRSATSKTCVYNT